MNNFGDPERYSTINQVGKGKRKKRERENKKLYTAGYFIPSCFLYVHLKILERYIPNYQKHLRGFLWNVCFYTFYIFHIFCNKNKM